MNRHNILSIALLTSALLLGCSKPQEKAPTSASASSAEEQKPSNINFEKYTLANGLDVVFHLDKSDPVVAVALTAHVGSAREKTGRTGFAHLFEHLLFLESENLGKGGLDKLSARIGGSGANGSTSRDRTNYFQTVPKDALEKMLWAEADKLGFFINTVTEPVLAKEKQVVKNEKRQRVDNRPYGHNYSVIDQNLYPADHPYHWQVIGSLADLDNATLDDVKQFYRRWYVPNNVTLVVAGDFEPEQAKAWIERYFAEIPAGEKIEPMAVNVPVLNETKKRFYEDNFAKLPQLTLVWPTIEQYHQDSYALDMLIELLSEGKNAPLNKVLVEQQSLTSRVNFYHYQSELSGQMAMEVRGFEQVDLNKVNQGIIEALTLFEQEKFTSEDLTRIKAKFETAHYQSMSSVLGKAFQLAQFNIFKDDPAYINQQVNAMSAVTADDIWRVYHRYLKNKPHVATSFVPKGQQSLVLVDSIAANVVEEKIEQGKEQAFDASVQATYEKTPSKIKRDVEPPYGAAPVIMAPKVWQQSLANGLTIYGVEHKEVPLVQFSLDIAGGMMFDSHEKSGLANLTAKLMNKGTKTKTPAELENAINQLGSSISIYASREGIHISGQSLRRNFNDTMALVTEMLTEPRWDAAEFTLLKQDVQSRIQQQQVNPDAIANNYMNKIMFGDNHVLANTLIGNENSVAAIQLSDLQDFYQQKVSPSLAKLHLVGHINQQQVVSSLKALTTQWQKKTVNLPRLTAANMPEKAQLYFYDVPDAKQSVIRVGHPSLKATDDDYYLATVMNYILGGGGFASQLTQELRETKGYTYSVRSRFNSNQYHGEFIISSGVRTNVTLESLQAIKTIVERYQANFNEQDLATTQSYYLKSSARLFETFSAKLSMLSNISDYGLPVDYVQQRTESVEALTVDKIKQLAANYLHPDKFIYVVVGDAKTQLPRLEALGIGEPVLLNP